MQPVVLPDELRLRGRNTQLRWTSQRSDKDQLEQANLLIVVKALKQTLTLSAPKLSEARPNRVQSLVQHFTIEMYSNAIKEYNANTKNLSASNTFVVALKMKGDVEEELRTALENCIDVFESFIDIGAVVETTTQVEGAFVSYKNIKKGFEGRIRTDYYFQKGSDGQSYIHRLREDQSKPRNGFKNIEEAVAKFNSKRGNMLEANNKRLKLKEASHDISLAQLWAVVLGNIVDEVKVLEVERSRMEGLRSQSCDQLEFNKLFVGQSCCTTS